MIKEQTRKHIQPVFKQSAQNKQRKTTWFEIAETNNGAYQNEWGTLIGSRIFYTTSLQYPVTI